MKTKTIKGYKFVQKDRTSHNENHTWHVGKWYKHDGKLELCSSGFHACREPLESLNYIYGDKWFIVEARGKIIYNKGDKFVAEEMRLIVELPIKKILPPFAIWCAKRCLKYYEKKYPKDKRPAETIKAAEDYLDKKIPLKELKEKISTARSAESPALSVAWSAECASWCAGESVARSAGESVARSAWSAARSVARSARSAQNKQLKKMIYSHTRKGGVS